MVVFPSEGNRRRVPPPLAGPISRKHLAYPYRFPYPLNFLFRLDWVLGMSFLSFRWSFGGSYASHHSSFFEPPLDCVSTFGTFTKHTRLGKDDCHWKNSFFFLADLSLCLNQPNSSFTRLPNPETNPSVFRTGDLPDKSPQLPRLLPMMAPFISRPLPSAFYAIVNLGARPDRRLFFPPFLLIAPVPFAPSPTFCLGGISFLLFYWCV